MDGLIEDMDLYMDGPIEDMDLILITEEEIIQD
jgi:hypothetical protein